MEKIVSCVKNTKYGLYTWFTEESFWVSLGIVFLKKTFHFIPKLIYWFTIYILTSMHIFAPLIILFNQIHILTESKQHLRPRQSQFCVNLTNKWPRAKDASNKCFIFQHIVTCNRVKIMADTDTSKTNHVKRWQTSSNLFLTILFFLDSLTSTRSNLLKTVIVQLLECLSGLCYNKVRVSAKRHSSEMSELMTVSKWLE